MHPEMIYSHLLIEMIDEQHAAPVEMVKTW